MIKLLPGDCRDVLATLPAESVQCVVTSPPYYGLRDYGTALWDGGDADCSHRLHVPQGSASSSTLRPEGKPHHHLANPDVSGLPFRDTCGKCGAVRVDRQIGLEATPDEYLATMVQVFREVRRVLRRDGTCWVNMGDSYNSGGSMGASSASALPSAYRGMGFIKREITGGLKPKDLLLMPARLALALQADGWWIRSDVIWHKPNPMPESVTDRCVSAHEHVFMLTKSARYYYDADAVRERQDEPWRSTGRIEDRGSKDVLAGINGGFGLDGQRPREYNPAGRNLRNVWTIATHAFSEWTPQHEIVQLRASEVPARGARGSAAGGDIARITSPDCPLHAGDPDRVPTGFYDGLSDDQVSRTRGNGSDPAQGNSGDSDATQRTLAPFQSHPSTMSYSGLEGAEIATPSNTESHKTGLDHLFSERAISSEEIGDGRPRTAPSQSPPALTDRDTGGSSSEADSSLSHCEPGTVADSSRTSALDGFGACRCGYYRKVTTKTSHFATFPPELAERCIKAGTSERGCCAACGKPWGRVTEKLALSPLIKGGDVPEPDCWKGDMSRPRQRAEDGTFLPRTDEDRRDNPTLRKGARAAVTRMGDGWDVTTTGWSPGCQCGTTDTRPCVVLDPFIGAGTTALVADRLQRDAIGIDLNTQYTRMAMDRCIADAPLLADLGPMPEHPEESAMADLFTDMAAD